MGHTSLSDEFTSTSSERGMLRLSLDDAIDDLRQTIRDIEVSTTFHDRLVVLIVYLFMALVVGLSLYIGFYGVP